MRKTKTVGATTYHYHYDGSNLIRITDQSNVTLWTFTWANGKPVSFTNNDVKTFFYVTNYRGDVVRIVDTAGAEVASYSYDSWGKVLTTTENAEVTEQPLGYASYVYDRGTKLYYLQARYYDPETARFISRDPDPGDSDDPITQNGYTYADNNPVNMVDPDGEWAQYALAAGIGAVTGAGKYYLMNELQGKKSTWKGAGGAALDGVVSGLMWTGAGRALGFISKGKFLMRAIGSKNPIGNLKQVGRHGKRLAKNPIKHLKKTPVKRLNGIKKAKKNSLKTKLIRRSNAIRRG